MLSLFCQFFGRTYVHVEAFWEHEGRTKSAQGGTPYAVQITGAVRNASVRPVTIQQKAVHITAELTGVASTASARAAPSQQ